MVMTTIKPQLEEALNDDRDENHFDQKMVDASAEMVQELYDGDYEASPSHHGVFVVEKHGNIDMERIARHQKLMRDYFNDPPRHHDDKPRRRFRMCRLLFTHIIRVVCVCARCVVYTMI